MSEKLELLRLELAAKQTEYDAAMRDEFPPEEVPEDTEKHTSDNLVEIERIRAEKELELSRIEHEPMNHCAHCEELERRLSELERDVYENDEGDGVLEPDGDEIARDTETVVHHVLEMPEKERAHESDVTPEDITKIADETTEKTLDALEENADIATEVVAGTTNAVKEKLTPEKPRRREEKKRRGFVLGRR